MARRAALTLLAGALALLILCSGAAPAGAQPKLRSCDIGANRPFRCGHIMVPAVRDKPEVGRQKIGFAIRPRGDRSRPSKGAIVFIEGGPGFAATNFDSIKPTAAVFAPFLKRYELIAIDQRGTGLSDPLNCRGLQRGRMPQQQALKACARQLGARRQGYTTAESAADIEAVRRAIDLPRRKMILYGDSYGTYLGQSYAARYGRGLKGLILSSAYPGNDPFWRTLYPAAERAVRLSCRRSPKCSGDALARFHRVVRRAPRGLSNHVLDYVMGDASSYAPGGYDHLNRAVSEYLSGEPAELRSLVDPGPPGSGSPRYFSEGMYAAVVCNDYPVPWVKADPIPARRGQLARAVAAFRPRDLFAPLSVARWAHGSAGDISACLSWPAPVPGMEPPIPPGRMPGRLRTLVLAGGYDSITSVREARQVNARFPRGRLYVVPSRGHASELYFPFASPATPRVRHFVHGLG